MPSTLEKNNCGKENYIDYYLIKIENLYIKINT